MKKIIILLIGMVFLVGCGTPFPIAPPIDVTPVQPPVNNVIPVNEVVSIKPIDAENTLYPYIVSNSVKPSGTLQIPGWITIKNLHSDSILDTWTKDGVASGDIQEFWSNLSGQPMGMKVANGTSRPVKAKLTYLVPESTVDIKSQGYTDYSPAPSFVKDWIKLAADMVDIEPLQAVVVPVSIVIPESMPQMPKKWAFYIHVVDASQKGMVQTDAITKWLVEMR